LVEEEPIAAESIRNATGAGDVLSMCMMLMHREREMELREKLRLANGIVTQHIEGRLVLIPSL